MNRFLSSVIALGLLGLLVGCDSEPTAGEYIKSGQQYVAKKEWKSAIIEFKNAVKQAPENAKARALLGQTYLETLSANAAAKELSRAISLGYDKSELAVPLGSAYRLAGENQKIIDEIEPSDRHTPSQQATIHAFRGIAYLALGDKSNAEDELDLAKSLDGLNTEVRLAWATLENSNGNFEAQERWLQPLLEQDGGIADAWSQMGELEQRKGNLDAADKAFTRAIEIRNIAHFDYVRRALVRIAANDFEGAEADIEFLKKAGANWPMLVHAEGLVDFRQNKFDEALVHFLDLLSKAPDFAPAQLMTGMTYFYQRNYENAIIYLDQHLAANPENSRASIMYAASLLALQKSAEALGVLEELNEKFPNDYRVLTLMSDAYLKQGRNLESLDAMQKAVKINPDQAAARAQLGSSLIRNPETAALGQQELKKALELDPSLQQAKLALFMSYLRGKQYTAALEAAAEIVKASPDQSLGPNLVALVYLAEGKDDQAQKQLVDALERFPADVLTSHNLGRMYIRNNAFDDARALYMKVIEKQPEHMQSLEQLALIAAREGKREDMMQWLQKAVERNPKSTRPKLILASQHLQQGNPSAATTILNGVDVEDKESTGFTVLMARAKIGVGELDHALRLLKKLTREQPNLAVGHFLSAQVYAAQFNIDEMRKSLERTVAIVPKHLMAQVFLAKIDLAQGKEQDFQKRLALLERDYPGNVQVELLKARQSSEDQDYDTAIKSLSGLLAQSPQSDVVLELARNQWQSGDRQGAISSLELWSQDNEDNRVLLLLAEYYLIENRDEEATRTYEVLDKTLPDDPRILNNLAWSMKDSNPDKGLEYARKAVTLSARNPLILDTLAMLTLRTGDSARALEISQEAVEKAPKIIDIQLNHAEILAANKKTTKAKRMLEAILGETNNAEVRKMVQQRLDELK